jgi:hypothetical protein
MEQNLNESMELYQNEVKELKNELNLIGTRMDYQYNDRFKKIEESVEGAQNRVCSSNQISYHIFSYIEWRQIGTRIQKSC